MAQNINYGSEIKNGGTIKSEHVSQFVDAFTGTEAYDIDISGSLDVIGTISGSFIGDGSGLTGLPTGSDGSQLTTKAGNIPSSSFQDTGSTDSYADVTFATPFSSSDYGVNIQATNFGLYPFLDNFSVENKTTSGFRIISDVSISGWGILAGSSVDYIAVANTETSVFTIPTSSFGLNTKVGTVPTSSYTVTGSYMKATVTFATPFSSSDYSVSQLGNGNKSYVYPGYSFLGWNVTDKTTSSFTSIFRGSPSAFNEFNITSIDYIAAAQGETAVTSSFTLSSATASYFAEGIVTASATGNTMTFTKDDGSTFDVDINSSELTTKAGNIPSSSFQDTGSGDSFATVTFATPFSSSDYSVALEFEIPSYIDYFTKTSIVDKTPAGFNILTEVQEGIWRLLPDSSINYIAVANTETSVFTIPTSSFGLNTKVGSIPSSSFQASGSFTSYADITFATPFSSSDYSVVTELEGGFQDARYSNQTIENKTTTGFRVFTDLRDVDFRFMPGSSITYIAAAQGETAVTSSFTLLSATASYVEQAQTASYALNNITFETLQVTNGTASIVRDLPLPDDIEVIQPNTLNSSGNAFLNFSSIGTPIDAVLPQCTSFNLPNNLRIIGDNNFIGHESPESIILPPNVEIASTSSFANVQTEIISCSNSLTSIGPGAFFNSVSKFPERDTYLKSITLNEGLQTIGEGAFCTAYNGGAYMEQSRFYATESISVNIPSSVTLIDSSSFFNRFSLNSVTFSPRTSSLIIGEIAFFGPLTPYSNSISNETTESTSFPLRINSIEIPDNTTLHREAFRSQAIETASIGDNCTLFPNIFSSPGGSETFILMDRFKRPRINSFTLPDTTILNNKSITEAPLSSAAFNNVIFSGSGWTEIPSSSFYKSVLKGFPNISQTNIDIVNSNAFEGGGFATSSLILPVSMSYSGSAIFKEVKLSSSIDVSASNDYSLTIGDHSDFTDKVVSPNNGSFYKTDISNLIIGNNVTFAPADELTSINRSTFTQNYIRSMIIGENVTFGKGTISDNQTKITGSTIFPATTTFYTSSFTLFDNNISPDLRGFDSVVFSGSGTTSIPNNCFNNSGIKALEFTGSGIQTLESNSFKGNDITGSVTFPSTLTDIGPLAFDGNNNLATASIPTSCITASDSFESSVHIIRF